MKRKIDERLLRFVLSAFAAALIVPLPQAALAQQSASHDPQGGGGVAAQVRQDIADHAGKDLRAFYAARDNAPLWLDEFDRPSGAATLLWLRMRTADRDGLEPGTLDLDKLTKLLDRAREGDPGDLARAELALSSTFVAYVKAMRSAPHVEMLYENRALAPVVPTGFAVLKAAADAPSLENYVDAMGWMNPLYAPLRKALDDPRYSAAEKQSIAAGAFVRTEVKPLDGPTRQEEIARMLAGARITEEARAAAGKLLSDVA